MAPQILPSSPLAQAIQNSIQPKLVEIGWGSGTARDVDLAEYIVLMLINGMSQEDIASELSQELLDSKDDPVAKEFAQWLFAEAESLHANLDGGQAAAGQEQAAPSGVDSNMEVQSTEAPSTSEEIYQPDVVMDSDMSTPTEPRSMRTGGNMPNGSNPNNQASGAGNNRNRMLGQVNKALDRTDNTLHRVRTQTGNERINSHYRGQSQGQRGNNNNHNNYGGRGGRYNNGNNNNYNNNPNNPNRTAASIQQGLAQMPPNGPQAQMAMNNMNMAGMAPWMMGAQPGQEIFTILEQQARMMEQLTQQVMSGGFNGNKRRGGGVMGGHRGGHNAQFRRGGGPRNAGTTHGQGQGEGEGSEGATGEAGASRGEGDVDMEGEGKAETNPEDIMCKFNLRCTNKDCKFAHQSPAAPPGTIVDTSDVCTFGAACKNHKCAGRHPSPAVRAVHQSEQDCKFFPNCQNQHCPFRHPSMPLCRFGSKCTATDCKFTHVKTKCKFKPCLNPQCPFAHEEGQQESVKNKVWTPATAAASTSQEAGDDDASKSERKFVDDAAVTEMVTAEGDDVL